jgi:transposase
MNANTLKRSQPSMEKEILFLGLDVDDQAFHVTAVSRKDGELAQFACKPIVSVLLEKLERFKSYDIHICYEASYLGYSLHRDFQNKSIHCDVIAPSSIPQVRGPRVKTDRIDSRQLANLYMNKLLDVVHVPTLEDETERDLIRSRTMIVKQYRATKLHINSVCRRMGINYKRETKRARCWTIKHVEWIERQANSHPMASLRRNLTLLLRTYFELEKIINQYDSEIETLSRNPKYDLKVKSLICYRGIKTQTAMTIATEIGDISRFSHPCSLTSFTGLDISEYSSGGKEKRYRITKMGNKYLRTAVIEACQLAYSPVKIGPDLRRRREKISPQYIDVADRCMNRLNKKGMRLILSGKGKNKTKVACAREMLGFIWESLNQTSKNLNQFRPSGLRSEIGSPRHST